MILHLPLQRFPNIRHIRGKAFLYVLPLEYAKKSIAISQDNNGIFVALSFIMV